MPGMSYSPLTIPLKGRHLDRSVPTHAGVPRICYENNFLQIRAASLTVPPILAPDTVFITTR